MDYNKYPYANKENIEKEIKEFKNLKDVELLQFLDVFVERKDILRENQRICKNDSAYWGFEAQYEETLAILEYLEDRVINYLKVNSNRVRELLDKEEELKCIKNRAIDSINSLKIYKPNNYTRTIEIVNLIFGNGE